jgi:hypothetical protein
MKFDRNDSKMYGRVGLETNTRKRKKTLLNDSGRNMRYRENRRIIPPLRERLRHSG